MILHTRAHLRLKKMAMRAYYGPLLSRGFDAVVAVSRGDQEMMREFAGLGSDTVRLIENGVSLTRYRTIVRRPEPGRILCFGRIDTHKGLGSLLRAVSKVDRPWQLDIVGVGPAEQLAALQRTAADLGVADRVRWLGRASDLELDELLARAAIAVFPSEFEGFGIALVEALAAGCVVVANDIATHREILGEGLADRLTKFDRSESIRAIEDALDVRDQDSVELESKARARAETFSIERLLGEIDELYEELGLIDRGTLTNPRLAQLP
jgi:alpha-1,3-mannosyltransferase